MQFLREQFNVRYLELFLPILSEGREKPSYIVQVILYLLLFGLLLHLKFLLKQHLRRSPILLHTIISFLLTFYNDFHPSTVVKRSYLYNLTSVFPISL